MKHRPYLLVDISNSFTKVARADASGIGAVQRIPTPSLSSAALRKAAGAPDEISGVVVASVVPARTGAVRRAFPGKVIEISPALECGIRIDYPNPGGIGADRIANAVAAVHAGHAPAIVIDFGTAVTFDVISADSAYVGGVIAPGLNAMTSYLHEKTALLPRVRLREPARAVGKSTEEAMLSGAVHGYRGLIREIVHRIRGEEFGGKKCAVLATGGDAELIAAGLPLFDSVDPLLTLRGLQFVAGLHFGAQAAADAISISVHNRQRACPANPGALKKNLLRLLPAILQSSPERDARPLPAEIEISIVSDTVIADAHRRFLNDPTPTDVITFPYGELLLGAGTIHKNAQRFGISFNEELLRCAVHGLLHLRGYDDLAPRSHKEMHNVQESILKEASTVLG